MDVGSIAGGAVAGMATAGLAGLIASWRRGPAVEERLKALEVSVNQRFEDAEQHRRELFEDVRSATVEMRAAAVQIAKLGEAQTVSIAFLTRTLDGIAQEQSRNSHELNEVRQTITFMRGCGGHCGELKIPE